ncbi:hypothetical protein ACTFIZ_012662 [Dictyostelium cf. discoideum]
MENIRDLQSVRCSHHSDKFINFICKDCNFLPCCEGCKDIFYELEELDEINVDNFIRNLDKTRFNIEGINENNCQSINKKNGFGLGDFKESLTNLIDKINKCVSKTIEPQFAEREREKLGENQYNS